MLNAERFPTLYYSLALYIALSVRR